MAAAAQRDRDRWVPFSPFSPSPCDGVVAGSEVDVRAPWRLTRQLESPASGLLYRAGFPSVRGTNGHALRCLPRHALARRVHR